MTKRAGREAPKGREMTGDECREAREGLYWTCPRQNWRIGAARAGRDFCSFLSESSGGRPIGAMLEAGGFDGLDFHPVDAP